MSARFADKNGARPPYFRGSLITAAYLPKVASTALFLTLLKSLLINGLTYVVSHIKTNAFIALLTLLEPIKVPSNGRSHG